MGSVMVRVWTLVAVLAYFTAAASALKFRALERCVNPILSSATTLPEPGMAIEVTADEFYSSFASIFRLTDGSRISLAQPTEERMQSLHYMQDLLRNVQVYVNETGSSASAVQLLVCGRDAVDILLLAVVGNFVSAPGDTQQQQQQPGAQSSLETMPSVAIDAATGQLVRLFIEFILGLVLTDTFFFLRSCARPTTPCAGTLWRHCSS